MFRQGARAIGSTTGLIGDQLCVFMMYIYIYIYICSRRLWHTSYILSGQLDQQEDRE